MSQKEILCTIKFNIIGKYTASEFFQHKCNLLVEEEWTE